MYVTFPLSLVETAYLLSFLRMTSTVFCSELLAALIFFGFFFLYDVFCSNVLTIPVVCFGVRAVSNDANISSSFWHPICYFNPIHTWQKQGRSKTAPRFQRFQESEYMDPKQGLCLGALFDIAATNVNNPCSILLTIFGYFKHSSYSCLLLPTYQFRDLIWGEDSVSLAFAVPSRCWVML